MTDGPLLLENGRIYPRPGHDWQTSAILFRDRKVAALGADAVEQAGAAAREVDLAGGTVLPGFHDAHTHPIWEGLQAIETDLSSVPDRATALERLRANAADTPPGKWVVGFGYDESEWSDTPGRYLDRDDLAAVSGEHPVAAQRVDGHTMSLNERALARIDFDGVEDDVETDTSGEPTGIVREAGVGRVRAAFRPGRCKAGRALDAAIDRALRLGLTSLQAMAGMTPAPPPRPILLALFDQWRSRELPLHLTVWLNPTELPAALRVGLPAGFGDDRVRFAGPKQFADGSIGAQTARLHEPYADAPDTRGHLVTTPGGLAATTRAAARGELPIATHAIGGAAIETVLDVYCESPRPAVWPGSIRRIEHVELATDAAIDRMANQHIIASMQPNYLQWSHPGGLYEQRLGTAAQGRDNRFRRIVEAGVPLAFGSDNMPFGPLYGIHETVNAPHPSQSLPPGTAIAAYTSGSARAEGTAIRKGTLAPGMAGDAVVLAEDPHAHPSEIVDIDVRMTIVGGEPEYEAASTVPQ